MRKIMSRLVWILAASAAALMMVDAQQRPDLKGNVTSVGQLAVIAVPDLHAAGSAQNFMAAFNQTLWDDLTGSGVLKLAPKTLYPRGVPQQPSDFRQPPPNNAPPRSRNGELTAAPTGGGFWMTDWSNPPASANYLAFGYAAEQNGVLMLFGNLFDLSRDTPANAQMIAKRYLATTDDEKGARQMAHEFAADILTMFGGKSLVGTHIYYVHQAGFKAFKEIWAMDPDGQNQHFITHFNSLSIEPSASPDGTKIAFTSYAKGTPAIFVFSVAPVRDLRFYNQVASMNGQPSFTPDGKQIVYSSSAGRCCRIFIAGVDGRGFRPITSGGFIDTEPKVNPKTGSTIVFSSGRSGPEQIYMMDMDGADVERLTDGTGEASNPSWHPNGQLIAYAWTRGYAQGNFNIFTMDVASRQYLQLTHDQGRNENPSWAPDGAHLAFMSNRAGGSQIWSMLADGTAQRQLTHDGLNYSPAWGM
jgi:TolB protein